MILNHIARPPRRHATPWSRRARFSAPRLIPFPAITGPPGGLQIRFFSHGCALVPSTPTPTGVAPPELSEALDQVFLFSLPSRGLQMRDCYLGFTLRPSPSMPSGVAPAEFFKALEPDFLFKHTVFYQTFTTRTFDHALSHVPTTLSPRHPSVPPRPLFRSASTHLERASEPEHDYMLCVGTVNAHA